MDAWVLFFGAILCARTLLLSETLTPRTGQVNAPMPLLPLGHYFPGIGFHARAVTFPVERKPVSGCRRMWDQVGLIKDENRLRVCVIIARGGRAGAGEAPRRPWREHAARYRSARGSTDVFASIRRWLLPVRARWPGGSALRPCSAACPP